MALICQAKIQPCKGKVVPVHTAMNVGVVEV